MRAVRCAARMRLAQDTPAASGGDAPRRRLRLVRLSLSSTCCPVCFSSLSEGLCQTVAGAGLRGSAPQGDSAAVHPWMIGEMHSVASGNATLSTRVQVVMHQTGSARGCRAASSRTARDGRAASGAPQISRTRTCHGTSDLVVGGLAGDRSAAHRRAQ